MVLILDGKYSYDELLKMPMSEIEYHLKFNEKFIKMRNEMMEEEKKKHEEERRKKERRQQSPKFHY